MTSAIWDSPHTAKVLSFLEKDFKLKDWLGTQGNPEYDASKGTFASDPEAIHALDPKTGEVK